jgi:hypothetical protein
MAKYVRGLLRHSAAGSALSAAWPCPVVLVALARRIEEAVVCARSVTHFVLEVSKWMAGSLSAGWRVHIRVSVSVVFR